MSNNEWWIDGDLPPPSMRQKYNLVRHFTPLSYCSPQFSPQNRQPEEKDKVLEQRLKNLNMDTSKKQVETLSSLEERAKMLKINDESQHTSSMSDIEQRLANLRGLPVEDIRYPRFATVYRNEVEEETVEKLMRRAKDEIMLEKKLDRSDKLDDEHDVNSEEFIKMCTSNASVPDELSGELPLSDIDIMGQDTIRNLKEIQQTMKLAKQRSVKAAKLTGIGNDNHSMDNEIKKLMTLTSQSNMKSEKINDELSKFWKRRMDNGASSSESSSKSENSDDEAEIDCGELQRVILEAEEAENEAMQMIKDSRKNGKKTGIFSRIFRPR
uniref:Fibrous sheath-interacting protein 1 n=1 Tax=Loa loa TaxID=7209 RepID=A0A1I7VRJ4_LOALO